MANMHDLIGVGIGPFNLSLAALSSGIPQFASSFFERKECFEWHSELVFDDACMQTTYLKDLVTPVDPTNPYSFLNYLVQKRCFYAFLNTNRKTISRQEFEAYCRWASQKLPNTHFSSPVREVKHDGKSFQVRVDQGSFAAQSICIGTGLRAFVPQMAKRFLGPSCFHAKSQDCKRAGLHGKRVLIIGGGQTGAEIFLNGLRGLWGQAQSIRWVSRRLNLEALDESAFANDYFTPDYVKRFGDIEQCHKDRIVAEQKLTSDGITASYLEEIYRELYRRTHVQDCGTDFEILTARDMIELEKRGDEYQVTVKNQARDGVEQYYGDVVILATGFRNELPECLEPLFPLIKRDSLSRPLLKPSFQMEWDGPQSSRLYAVNFGRHSHGIAEPQTSLMAWRSATILNDILGRDHFSAKDSGPAFLRH